MEGGTLIAHAAQAQRRSHYHEQQHTITFAKLPATTLNDKRNERLHKIVEEHLHRAMHNIHPLDMY